MTHLPFIAASYALGLLVPGTFGVSAYLRMRSARRRLAAIDPRAKRAADDPFRQRTAIEPLADRGAR